MRIGTTRQNLEFIRLSLPNSKVLQNFSSSCPEAYQNAAINAFRAPRYRRDSALRSGREFEKQIAPLHPI